MAIFRKNDPKPQKPRDRAPQPARGGSADGAISIIGTGMTVVGDILTEGIVRVEGEVRGTIRAGKAVVLGQDGLIEGDVFTEDALIGGRVSGSIIAGNRLDLQSTCTVEGEIRTRAEHLKLEEGARFAGQVHIIEEVAPNVSGPTHPGADLTKPGNATATAHSQSVASPLASEGLIEGAGQDHAERRQRAEAPG